jgi:hypothetical protein
MAMAVVLVRSSPPNKNEFVVSYLLFWTIRISIAV